jgi:MFS family permease
MSQARAIGAEVAITGSAASQRSETRHKVAIIVGAFLGDFASVNVLLLYSVGVFISTLNHTFGWSHAETAMCMTWFTIVVFLGSSLIGRLADWIDPGRLASVSMLCFGVLLTLMPNFVHSVGTLWIAYIILAIVGLGTSPVVLTKPVISGFTTSRGFALGLALTGGGVGAFAAPRLATAFIERGGWKAGYVGLGLVAIVTAPFIWTLLGHRVSPVAKAVGVRIGDYPGVLFREACRLREFWILSIFAFLAGFGVSGPVAHLVPFFRDRALSPTDAGALASMMGLSNLVGRLTSGVVLDRFKGPSPGLPLLGIGAVGIFIAVAFGAPAALTAVLLLGFAIGAEISLLGYFTSRYFGLRAHAAIFGWNYGMVALGAAIGPVVVGALRDNRGNYDLGFYLTGGALALAASLCPMLGRYRFFSGPAPATEK